MYKLEIDRLSVTIKQKILTINHNLSFSYPAANGEKDPKNTICEEKKRIKKKIFLED